MLDLTRAVEAAAKVHYQAMCAEMRTHEQSPEWDDLSPLQRHQWCEALVLPVHAAAQALMSDLSVNPPAGWETFDSHHTDQPVPALEFYGDDGAGLPLWERVVDGAA